MDLWFAITNAVRGIDSAAMAIGSFKFLIKLFKNIVTLSGLNKIINEIIKAIIIGQNNALKKIMSSNKGGVV